MAKWACMYPGRMGIELDREQFERGNKLEHGVCLCCGEYIADDGSKFGTICPYCAGHILSIGTAFMIGRIIVREV